MNRTTRYIKVIGINVLYGERGEIQGFEGIARNQNKIPQGEESCGVQTRRKDHGKCIP